MFQYVRTQTVKAAASPAYQIDVLGREQKQDKVWFCECKYTRQPMGIKQVEKLEAAVQVFRQQLEEERLSVPEIQLWLISTGGFTEEVKALARCREDMYVSDYEGVNNIFKAFGGNYSIPLFDEKHNGTRGYGARG
ncbi:Restriction endonuclease [Candidatus Electrothrix marina]|uniref:Restriction endonuclease n=1 Tax=Candidatus Electrothrix marina TaxID=1859130 RepID=A0A444JHA7_9BACT|nr:Restriction endonuclease [Candidatus Electrothrix marina]